MMTTKAIRHGRDCALACLVLAFLPYFWPHLFDPLSRQMPTLFSEWEAPKPLYDPLLQAALNHRLEEGEPENLWSPPEYKDSWHPCEDIASTTTLTAENTTGYLQVFLEGGLNQQRMAICDAVALAKLLGVTLVLPYFDVNPFWKDASSFADIFDVDYFLKTLEHDVSIVREVPYEFAWSSREYYATGIRATRVKNTPVSASPRWFRENVLPVIQNYGIAAVVPFSHRLAYDGIPPHIQRLRCKVNFRALRFVDVITSTGDAIIRRMRSIEMHGSKTPFLQHEEATRTPLLKVDGKYVALHLRFEKDMAAHSACDFGGGKVEQLALAKYRRDLWQGRVSNSLRSPVELRNSGKCPLTPEEIGLLLVGLGFTNMTRLYLASYKVYGGPARMPVLRSLFPFMQNKFSLTNEAKMASFIHKASVSAAIDYYVSLHSDVFISASPGNMHNALVAHRVYEGVRKTVRPNFPLLGQLFSRPGITWREFQEEVRKGHENRVGRVKLRQRGQSLYMYPAPECLCNVSR